MVSAAVSRPVPSTQPFSSMPRFPGGSLVMGNLQDFAADPIGLFLRARHEHGPLVRFRIGPQGFVLVTDPESAHAILVDNQRAYDKHTRGYQKLKLLLGNGLLTSNGDFWLRQRRIAQPAFHRDRIAGFAETMLSSTDAMLDRWAALAASGAPVDVSREMMRVTLRIVGLTLLSSDVEQDAEEVGHALTVALHRTDELITSFLPFADRWPTEKNRAYHHAKSVLDGVVGRIIAERRAGQDAPDLLSMLMHARDEETGEGMTDAQLRDEIMTMFLAGHETTANALAWALHYLDQHPDIADRLAREVDEAAPGRRFGLEALRAAPLLGQVIDETLRLSPPAWMVARNSREDAVLGGFEVPKGTYHLVSIIGLHRDPSVWKDPDTFRPERFAEGTKDVPRGAYIPFIEGPRMCIGKSFALMEAKLILANIVRRFRFSHVEGTSTAQEAAITLRPKDGLMMHLAPR